MYANPHRYQAPLPQTHLLRETSHSHTTLPPHPEEELHPSTPSPHRLTHTTTGIQLPSRVEERRRERLVRPTHVLRSLPREHVAEHARFQSTAGSTFRSWCMPYCIIEATISSSWSFSMVYLISTSSFIVFMLRDSERVSSTLNRQRGKIDALLNENIPQWR